MKTITVKVINNSKHPLPAYSTEMSAGMDLRANLETPVTIPPLGRALIPSGLHIELPVGYEVQVRPRSGLALKHGITLANAPGTIDADYRGDIGAIVQNLGSEPFTVNDGDRICQLVVKEYIHCEWKPVNSLESSDRGDGGYGHTGVK